MLTLHNRNEVPQNGFRYFQTDTEQWLTAPSFQELLSTVKRHRKANNLPIGSQFDAEIEHQLCQNSPPETCIENDLLARDSGRSVQHGPVTFQKAMDTANMLVDWFLNYGRAKVDPSLASARAAVCVRCPHNQQIEGCSGCNRKYIRRIVERIVGSESTPHDTRLYACSICGCSLRAKIWLPLDLLLKHLTPSQLADFPAHCWLPNEIAGINPTPA